MSVVQTQAALYDRELSQPHPTPPSADSSLQLCSSVTLSQAVGEVAVILLLISPVSSVRKKTPVKPAQVYKEVTYIQGVQNY